ncbi:DNA processing protein [Dysgonomonas hofstadii]|uniref:DNA processing protein n=1 Tax=Dysgonomonas hofstadii TaxID=637886 RepID=A0A840CKZ5_9BACT|nr:DNA-processing protein DprA [Dysgonomonas hofstadii]MBB4036660.1 DNA processing protein [Dysgonomonas hofstadii]
MTMLADKRIYQIALTMIPGIGDITARNILQVVGDEEKIFKSDKNYLINKIGLSLKLAGEILNPGVLVKAEKELSFIEKNNISTHFINEDSYPNRLRECADAPVLIYNKGNFDFNVSKIISIVGTRQSTSYGNHFCDSFLDDISRILPGTLIISGLAYGIDIHAHRAALKHNLPTIGVLAHGLDIIYPSVHRQIAMEMINNGGLLTEFPSGTEPERHNFVRRNRIVAGMADAIIVVESDEKGGSLITAEIANSYCKDVFAVPGKITDRYSKGCNKLIASHKADLFKSTEYFLQQMGWDEPSKQKQITAKQQELFIILTDEEQSIVNKLSRDGLHIDQLSRELNIPAYQLFTTLLEMEMKGIIKNTPGNLYIKC